MLKKIVLIIVLLSFGQLLWSGVTGKIAGTIIDAKTQEPLPGVNVLIEGTTLGASSDVDGYFVILNIPPGTYTLQALFVGYQTVAVSDVKVSVDLTTKINLQMTETTLETSEAITVIADRPIIRMDEVSTRHLVTSQEIEIQPVTSFQQIALNQAGVVGTHFRGGRSGEVLVLIDGIAVRDPAGVYSGGLGGFTGSVPDLSIQEMEVSLGGFSAEYGNVQSGLLNLALKEGSLKYSGKLRYTNQSPFGSESSFTEKDVKFKRLQPVLNIYELNLSGPIVPDLLSFSFSGEITDRNSGMYMNQQSFEQTYQGKLSLKLSPQHRLSFGTIITRSEWDSYYFPASVYGPGPDYQYDSYVTGVKTGTDTLDVYRYVRDENLFGTTTTENSSGKVDGDTFNVIRSNYMAGMQEYLWNTSQATNMAYLLWSHTISPTTFYEARFNTFYTNYHYATPDVDDRDHDGDRDEDLQWNPTKAGPHPIYREREENYWWVRGDDPGYRDQQSWVNSFKLDLVSQFDKNNLFKGGLEFNLNETDVENISWTLGVGINRKDIWKQQSLDFAAYVQDKLEFEGIIALVGMRFDVFNPNGFGSAIEFPGDYNYPYSQVDEDGIPIISNPQKAETQYQWSPRIGISHPITAQSVLHFTYGHYFQRPDGYYLYRNYKIQSPTKVGNMVGNPGLKSEKTVAYELGLEQQLFNDFKFTVTGYYKDVTNLMNWRKYVGRSIGDVELNVFTNADYGNIKGMELALVKRLGQLWGGNLSYTYSIAKGRSSSSDGGSGSFTDAKRMNILDFDQTHTIKANVTLRTPAEFGFALANMQPLAGWTANIQFSYGSGLPYTSAYTRKINDKRMPWTITTDMKIMREIRIFRYGLSLFMDIYNVFNRKNVNYIGNTEYYEFGHASDATVKGDPSVVYRAPGDVFYRNAQAYSLGRQIRFGFGIFF